MGVFSWDCNICGHSMLSPDSVGTFSDDPKSDDRHDNSWMMEVVVFLEGGTRLIGVYDGYGRVNANDMADYNACCYHKSCWEKAGKPEYTEPSESSRDQGYFFTPDEHDLPDPLTVTEEEFTRAIEKTNNAEKWMAVFFGETS